jgi:secreted PhoX family phosphatase
VVVRQLQVAQVNDALQIQWLDLTQPNPGKSDTQTRHELKAATRFNGGEGIWYRDGVVYFTTKGDNRVWQYTPATGALRVIYALAESKTPILSGVDNITATAGGDLLVAEDGGHMQIVIIDRRGQLAPLLRITGQDSSEIAGPAFSPDGSRLYFSSQRGGAAGSGITYEVSGPFGRFVG